MTDKTTLLEIEYPSEFDDPYWADIAVMYGILDQWIQSNQEDKSLIISGGGTLGLVGNTFSWTGNFTIRSLKTGALLTILPSSLTVADGEIVYVTATRPLSTGTVALNAGNPANKERNVIPIGVRSGSNMHMYDTAETAIGYVTTVATDTNATLTITAHGKLFYGISGNDDPVIFTLPLNPTIGFEVMAGAFGTGQRTQASCQGSEDILLPGGAIVTQLQSEKIGSIIRLHYNGSGHWVIVAGVGEWKDDWDTPVKQYNFDGDCVYDNQSNPYSTGSIASGGGTHTHEFKIDGLIKGLVHIVHITMTAGTSTDVTIQIYDADPGAAGVLIYEVPNFDFSAGALDDRNVWYAKLAAADSLWLKATNDGAAVATLAIGLRIKGE